MSTMRTIPTRAAALELKAERVVVGEAYDFLDEKRLLLAAELLRQLAEYERLRQALDALRREAASALARAIAQHGLQGLSIYPAREIEAVQYDVVRRNFMGVMLVDTRLRLADDGAVDDTVSPSSEACRCQQAFRRLLQLSSELAGISGNLYRLLVEYRRTERRARALENVILPEIEQMLHVMSSHLEELEFEDAVRVRICSRQAVKIPE